MSFRSRPVVLGLLAIATVAALAVALREVDPSEAMAALAGARWDRAAWMFCGFAVNHGLRAVRWHRLLDAAPLGRSLQACWIGFLAISLLPLRLGEAVRPAFHAADGVPLSTSVTAVLAERLLDLCGLVLFLLGVTLWVDLPPVIVDGVDVIAAGQKAAAVAVGALAVGLLAVAAFGSRLAPRLPVGGAFAGRMSTAVRDLAKDPLRAATAVVLTAAIWGTTVVYVQAALSCFAGVPATWEAASTTWAAIVAAIVVLPTPGFFGSYELAGASALRLLGAGASVAATTVLFMHLAYIAFATAVGLPAILREGRVPGVG